MAPKPKLESIRARFRADEDPDLSYLGEFNSKGGPESRTIDHAERSRDRRALPFFVAALSGEETGNPESVEQDYKRLLDYGNGWLCVGIDVEATVNVSGHLQRITSGGLWGIESDSGRDYFEEVVREELEALRLQLRALGVRVPKTLTAEVDREACLSGPVSSPLEA